MPQLNILKITFLLIVLNINVTQSQVKNEREEKVALTDFPAQAQKVIELLPKACKRLKFFRETDGDKLSYEAKFKLKKKLYSLEFSNEGHIEDIELKIKPKSLKPEIKNNIKNYFNQKYLKTNWIKLQRQFVYDSSLGAKDFIITVFNDPSVLKSNFELIAEVKTKDEKALVEFLFDPMGNIIKQSIVSPSSYDHVLY